MMRIELVLAILVTTLTLAGSGCAVGPRQPTFAPSPTRVQQPTDTRRPEPTTTSGPSSTEEATGTPLPKPTQTPRLTGTPRPTSTATPVPTFALTGAVFFDYNGNGAWDDPEPPIQDAIVQVDGLTTVSAPDGTYKLEGVPEGQQAATVSGGSFRFVSLSPAGFVPSDRPIALAITGNTERDWGLMQGFLTLPFSKGTQFQRGESPFGQDSLFDLNNLDSVALAYDGTTHPCSVGQFPCVKDGHAGIDFGVRGNTVLLAAAPGAVVAVYEVPGDHPVGKVIVDAGIEVTIPLVYRNGTVQWETQRLCIQYAHVISPTVDVGDRVVRGQQLGLIDPWGAGPHLHFQPHGYIDRYDERAFTSIDPYLATQEVLDALPNLQDIAELLSGADSVTIPSNYLQDGFNGLWTVANAPVFPGDEQ